MLDTTSESWLDTIWSNAELTYGMNEDASMSILLLVAGLIVVAVGIGIHILLKERGKKVSFGGAASYLLTLLWLRPIAAVCLMVALPALWYFSFSAPPVRMNARPRQVRIDVGVQETHAIATTLEAESSLSDLTEGENESSLPESTEGEDAAEPERPTWVDAGDIDDGTRRLVVVQGKQFPLKTDAEEDALQEAVQLVRADFQQTRNVQGRWKLHRSLVKRKAVKKTFVEPIQRSTGINDFSVVRVYHQVELSDHVRDAIYPSWQGQIVDGRLWVLGGILGFITLMLGTSATYLRLDMLTKGNYRRRLKLASVSLIVAGGLGLANFLPLI